MVTSVEEDLCPLHIKELILMSQIHNNSDFQVIIWKHTNEYYIPFLSYSSRKSYTLILLKEDLSKLVKLLLTFSLQYGSSSKHAVLHIFDSPTKQHVLSASPAWWMPTSFKLLAAVCSADLLWWTYFMPKMSQFLRDSKDPQRCYYYKTVPQAV